MELPPEERRKIYEEEKARREAEQREKVFAGESSTSLEPNVAGLLCYVGFWISGIILLVIEQKNRFVRFHALQSIIVFGALAIAGAILHQLPFVGSFFSSVIWIVAFVLWIVLMVKAYQGELYKVAGAGDLAERIAHVSHAEKRAEPENAEQVGASEVVGPPESPSAALSQPRKAESVAEDRFASSRGERITASAFAIAWSIAFLVFFSFYSDYVAYYQPETVGNTTTWTRLPLLTGEYYDWLPVLVTTLVLSILGHVILIVSDRYWLRQVVVMILNLFGIGVVVTLLYVFPFDFTVIPNPTVATILPIVVTIVLIAIAIGLGIGTLVMFIKSIVHLARQA